MKTKRSLTFIVILSLILSMMGLNYGFAKEGNINNSEVLLTGTPFGSGGENVEAAFDGDIDTYFVGGSDSIIGIDLGEGNEAKITKIRVFAMGSKEEEPWLKERVPGVYEGSMDGINYEPLVDIWHEDVVYGWNEFEVTSQKKYRYLRFSGVEWFNKQVAELEFYGIPGAADEPEEPDKPAGEDNSIYNFESDLHGFKGLTDPQYEGLAIPERDDTRSFLGKSSMKVTFPGGKNSGIGVTPDSTLKPGTFVKIRVFVPEDAPDFLFNIIIFDSSWQPNLHFIGTDSLTKGQWQELTATFKEGTAPSQRIAIEFLNVEGTDPIEIWIDSIDYESETEPEEPNKNLIVNGDFAKGKDGWWTPETEIVPGAGVNGSNALKLPRGKDDIGAWQDISLIPGATYKLIVTAKATSGVGTAGIQGDKFEQQVLRFQDSNDWETKEVTFTVEENGDLQVFIYKSDSDTEFWVDNVVLERKVELPSMEDGNFSINDRGQILDPHGNVFIVKGTNVNGPHWPWPRDTVQDVDLIVDVWKFNTVRVNMYPKLAPHGFYSNTDLDAIVEAFTSRGVVTIIEDHDFTGLYPGEEGVWEEFDNAPDLYLKSLEEFKDYWVDLAKRYKDNPYVWFNPINEPGPGGLDTAGSIARWKEVHEVLVDAIRNEAGAENIIVLDGHNWGQEGGFKNGITDSAILTHGEYFNDKYENIVYSLHLYSGWANGQSRLENYFNIAKSKGLALIIGEYGGGKNPSDLSATQAMFNAAVPNGIGRIFWHWDGSDDHALTEEGGGYKINDTSGRKPTNLTWVGSHIWDDNHNQLELPVELIIPLLTNGDFSDGLTGWWSPAGEVIPGAGVDGSNALKLEGGSNIGAWQQTPSIKPLTKYKLVATARVIGGEETLGFQYGSRPDLYQQILYFDSEEWTTKEVIFTTGEDIIDPNVFIYKGSEDTVFWVDSVSLTEVIEVVDKEKLAAAIQEAEQLLASSEIGEEPGQYPKSAIDALSAAIDEAKRILADEDVLQQEVDEGLEALREAIDIFLDLVNPPVDEEPPGEEEPPVDEEPPGEEDPPVDGEPPGEEEPPVDEEPPVEEEPPIDEEPPGEEKPPIDEEPPSDKEPDELKPDLPTTFSPIYNILLLGFALLAVGVILYYISRIYQRRIAEK